MIKYLAVFEFLRDCSYSFYSVNHSFKRQIMLFECWSLWPVHETEEFSLSGFSVAQQTDLFVSLTSREREQRAAGERMSETTAERFEKVFSLLMMFLKVWHSLPRKQCAMTYLPILYSWSAAKHYKYAG